MSKHGIESPLSLVKEKLELERQKKHFGHSWSSQVFHGNHVQCTL